MNENFTIKFEFSTEAESTILFSGFTLYDPVPGYAGPASLTFATKAAEPIMLDFLQGQSTVSVTENWLEGVYGGNLPVTASFDMSEAFLNYRKITLNLNTTTGYIYGIARVLVNGRVVVDWGMWGGAYVEQVDTLVNWAILDVVPRTMKVTMDFPINENVVSRGVYLAFNIGDSAKGVPDGSTYSPNDIVLTNFIGCHLETNSPYSRSTVVNMDNGVDTASFELELPDGRAVVVERFDSELGTSVKELATFEGLGSLSCYLVGREDSIQTGIWDETPPFKVTVEVIDNGAVMPNLTHTLTTQCVGTGASWVYEQITHIGLRLNDALQPTGQYEYKSATGARWSVSFNSERDKKVFLMAQPKEEMDTPHYWLLNDKSVAQVTSSNSYKEAWVRVVDSTGLKSERSYNYGALAVYNPSLDTYPVVDPLGGVHMVVMDGNWGSQSYFYASAEPQSSTLTLHGGYDYQSFGGGGAVNPLELADPAGEGVYLQGDLAIYFWRKGEPLPVLIAGLNASLPDESVRNFKTWYGHNYITNLIYLFNPATKTFQTSNYSDGYGGNGYRGGGNGFFVMRGGAEVLWFTGAVSSSNVAVQSQENYGYPHAAPVIDAPEGFGAFIGGGDFESPVPPMSLVTEDYCNSSVNAPHLIDHGQYFNTASDLRIAGVWAVERPNVGPTPLVLYPQFFMSFAKSYEVRGYKP